ncbi:MAG: amidohydrolase [Chloroflexota bacterium]
MTIIDFKTRAQAMRADLVARRRDFHMHPELGFEEFRTSGIIAEELGSLGLQVETGVGKTGVVALLEGGQIGPTIMVRVDMDALPLTEANQVDYVSQTPGKMHACGHDGHVTIGLAVAKLLSEYRDKIAGQVKFVFQPAEEGLGGALAMIGAGVLDNPRPDVVLGLHLWSELPIGTIGIADGAIMSGSSIFRLIVNGKGGHAAMPYTTIDPVACAGQLITALHTIVGRKMDAMAGAVVLSVTGVRTSSEAYNAIPQQVEIRGTFRTFNAYTSEMLEQHIRSLSESVCASVGCTVDIMIKHLTIPVVNDPEVTDHVRGVFSRFVDVNCLDDSFRTMASEDISYMLDEVPGTFFFVGAGNKARGFEYGHHHPRFDFDEDALPLGVALMSAAVADYVLVN